MTHVLRSVGVIDAQLRDRLGAAARFATLEDVVRWPDGTLVEVIVQDEFTHDVIVRALSPAYVVFDTT